MGLKASSGLGFVVRISFSSNFGNGKSTERGGALENGSFETSSSFLTGSLGRPGTCILGMPCRWFGRDIRGIPPNGGMCGRFGKEVGISSFGRPGIPIGGFVPGGITGSMPAMGFLASGGGMPFFSASSMSFRRGG